MKYFLLALLMTSVAAAQNYELKSKNFSLRWKETNGLAEGTYRDTQLGETAVKGISGDLGRIFVATYPREIQGVRTVTILTTDMSGGKGSTLVPLSYVSRDAHGKPIKTQRLEANLSATPVSLLAQRQEANECREGFGSLAGVCGIYTGIVVEEEDASKQCDLMVNNMLRLGVNTDGSVALFLGEVSDIVEVPVHEIGRLPANPAKMSVDLLSRACRPLPGTQFPGDNCKRLNLSGDFSTDGDRLHFRGVYSLVDEKTNRSCRYMLSLDQQP